MAGVLIGFAIIAVVILVGWILGRLDVLGSEAESIMSRLAFFVLSPALLFTTLARADLGTLFGRDLPVSIVSSGSVIVLSLLVSFLVLRRRTPEAVVNALGAGYANAANIGVR